jgi:hypothetical protein
LSQPEKKLKKVVGSFYIFCVRPSPSNEVYLARSALIGCWAALSFKKEEERLSVCSLGEKEREWECTLHKTRDTLTSLCWQLYSASRLFPFFLWVRCMEQTLSGVKLLLRKLVGRFPIFATWSSIRIYTNMKVKLIYVYVCPFISWISHVNSVRPKVEFNNRIIISSKIRSNCSRREIETVECETMC